MYEIKGHVYSIGDKQQITDKFSKREITLFIKNEQNEKYPHYINFETLNANCDLLEGISPKDFITIRFSVTGRLYQDKVYNSLILNSVAVMKKAPVTQPTAPVTPPENFDDMLPDDMDDDLPF